MDARVSAEIAAAAREVRRASEMREVAERHHLHAMEMNEAALVIKAVARAEYQLALDLIEESAVLRRAVRKAIDESREELQLHEQDVNQKVDQMVGEFREKSGEILKEAGKAVEEVMEMGNKARECREKTLKDLEEAEKKDDAAKEALKEAEKKSDAAKEALKEAEEKADAAKEALEEAKKDAEAADAVRERQQVTRPRNEVTRPRNVDRKLIRLQKMAEHPVLIVILMFIGAGSSYFFPFYLTTKEVKWSCAGIALFFFVISSMLRYKFRNHAFMRTTHGGIVFGLFNMAMFAFTAWLGLKYTTTEQSVTGFLLLATSVFCWLEIVRPTYDYGILSLFMNLPIQVAINHYKPKFNKSYIYATVVPLFYLTCQGFFARLMDLVTRRLGLELKAGERELDEERDVEVGL